MNKSFIKVELLRHERLALRRLETGFSMLEAIVVVGVLLALAVGGFLSYGPIIENAKIAKAKSAASEVYTAVMVAQIDGDLSTEATTIVAQYNASNPDYKAEIRAGGPAVPAMTTTGYVPTSDNDFCLTITYLPDPSIYAEMGNCSDAQLGGELPDGGDGGVVPDPVTQPAVMVSTWDTRIAGCTTITLPLTGEIDVTINWGDGTAPKEYTTALPSYPYADAAGIKTIRIDGTFTGWGSADWPDWSADCITEVTEWGDTGTTDVTAGFSYATNLTDVARIPQTATDWNSLFYATSAKLSNLNDLDTSRVTSLNSVFSESGFNSDISSWDTSQVTDMSWMFYMAPSFNQPIGNWDTSNVTNLELMFSEAGSFNQSLDWDTSKVTTLEMMFLDAPEFDGDISGWDTSSVTNMKSALSGTAFNGDVSNWNTANVTNMQSMFSETPFNGDVSRWNTANVTNMDYMFQSSLFNGDVSNWNTAKVTTMTAMFQGTPFSGNVSGWNTSNVTRMDSMFLLAKSFNSDISGWDTSKVTNMQSMFMAATAFNQNLTGWNVSGVTASWSFATDGAGLTAENHPVFPAGSGVYKSPV